MSEHPNHKYTNALVNESSPYLLQHAHNPVDWHPWNEEVLEKAKKENKLLIISIGYAACHWCHVMEHESFEDSTVASIMNEHFINIKVDREERPDIDNVYMTACQLASGRGCGWPLNAFALPDGSPVWAGTYFPKEQWMNVLNQFIKLKANDPNKLDESAKQLSEGINVYEQISLNTEDKEFTTTELNSLGNQFVKRIDFKDGGRIGSPKFPMPNNYEFMLKYHHLSKDEKSMEAVKLTLDKMALGGIYDQLGGGFARYSVDTYWLVPHFEKMLYDNGQLISLYSHAYQLNKSPLYEKTVKESIDFVKRELMSEEFGFYSSLDADSEGVEGKFYVWEKHEIDSILNDSNLSDLFCEFYDVTEEGNFEEKNILNVVKEPSELIKKYQLTEKEFAASLDLAKEKLMSARDQRIRPGLDDKILCSWNGLMLSGLLDAYQAFGDDSYLELALKNAQFIENNFIKDDGRLDRNYKNGKSSINAFLDDYAVTIDAFIKLYQTTFDESWLDKADRITKYVFEHFLNDENKLFNYTSDLDPPLVSNKIEMSDNVIPASNSIMARNLNALSLYLNKNEYKEQSLQMMKNVLDQMTKAGQPNFYSNWCQLYLDFVKDPYEVAIVGPDAQDLRKELSTHYLSNTLLLGGENEGSLALLKNKLQEGETKIYVCQNKVCKFPVDNVADALKLMD